MNIENLETHVFDAAMFIITEVYINKTLDLADIEMIEIYDYDKECNTCDVKLLSKKNNKEISLTIPFIQEAFDILYNGYETNEIEGDPIEKLDILYYNKSDFDVIDADDLFSA